jgi:hypothetical protein
MQHIGSVCVVTGVLFVVYNLKAFMNNENSTNEYYCISQRKVLIIIVIKMNLYYVNNLSIE